MFYESFEGKEGYKIVIEVPGVSKEDLKIEIIGNNKLAVSGVRKPAIDYTQYKYIYDGVLSETSQAGTFGLPQDSDIDNIKSKLENGILVITIPKKVESKKIILVE